jgi:molybdate transport system substrate-binding protein
VANETVCVFSLEKSPIVAAVASLLALASEAHAGDTNVAVAANFTEPASGTGHKATLSFGATGQFYTQITQGASFQVFLSADESTPKKLVEKDFAVADSLFTYAIGKLVLFSTNATTVTGEQTLRDAKFNKIAIAHPANAPYGAAAVETMKALGLYDALAGKIVQGSDIAQAFLFVDTGNAEVGFVALSQVVARPGGSRWIVPANLYREIRQAAVLLRTGTNNEAAKAFLVFMKGPDAAKVMEKYGYGVQVDDLHAQ